MHFWLLFFPHAVFDILKGALLQPERAPFGTQKTAFWKPKGIILITNKLQNVFLKGIRRELLLALNTCKKRAGERRQGMKTTCLLPFSGAPYTGCPYVTGETFPACMRASPFRR